MGINRNIVKKVFLFLILIILIFPIIQNSLNLFEIEPLNGAIIATEEKDFKLDDWFNGVYQEETEKHLNESFGFRNTLVRLNNQISFCLFKKVHANSVIIGKNNYLFELNYIRAYNGDDFIGMDSSISRFEKLRFIQDTLKKLNKTLMLVFAAGKGTFYNEFFPNEYKKTPGTTNYKTHVQLAKKYGINYIDFNSYFLKNKKLSKYPLYPQYGIHWSNYGVFLAADSIVRFIENVRKIDMNNFFYNKVDIAQPHDVDYDIGSGLNLMHKLKSFNMAYPEFGWTVDSTKSKPSIIVISDSFFWDMYNHGFSNVYDSCHFWYYNRNVYPNSFTKPCETSQLDLKKEVEKHEIILIMATEATLPEYGWGFIEQAYKLFYKGE